MKLSNFNITSDGPNVWPRTVNHGHSYRAIAANVPRRHFGAQCSQLDHVRSWSSVRSKRSDRDKDVSFYRIPTVRTGRGRQEMAKHRTGFVAAISREDLNERALNQARIWLFQCPQCSSLTIQTSFDIAILPTCMYALHHVT